MFYVQRCAVMRRSDAWIHGPTLISEKGIINCFSTFINAILKTLLLVAKAVVLRISTNL